MSHVLFEHFFLSVSSSVSRTERVLGCIKPDLSDLHVVSYWLKSLLQCTDHLLKDQRVGFRWLYWQQCVFSVVYHHLKIRILVFGYVEAAGPLPCCIAMLLQ